MFNFFPSNEIKAVTNTQQTTSNHEMSSPEMSSPETSSLEMSSPEQFVTVRADGIYDTEIVKLGDCPSDDGVTDDKTSNTSSAVSVVLLTSLAFELHLVIFKDLGIKELLNMRSLSVYWRSFIDSMIATEHDLEPTRKRLLRLLLRITASDSFKLSRCFTNRYLCPFSPDDYIKSIYDLLPNATLPVEFEMWLREWPEKASFGGLWPGFAYFEQFAPASDVQHWGRLSGFNSLAGSAYGYSGNGSSPQCWIQLLDDDLNVTWVHETQILVVWKRRLAEFSACALLICNADSIFFGKVLRAIFNPNGAHECTGTFHVSSIDAQCIDWVQWLEQCFKDMQGQYNTFKVLEEEDTTG